MKASRNILVFILMAVIMQQSALTAFSYPDPYHAQDFESWTPEQLAFGTWYWNNWCISNGVARTKNPFGWNFDPQGGTMMGGLNAPLPNGSYPGYSLRTPLMTNGAGTVSFYFQTAYASPNVTFEVLSSTNSGTTWTTNGTMSAVSPGGWTYYSTPVNIYGDAYVKIEKRGDGNQAGQYLVLDTVLITLPPAYADISDVTLSPVAPLTETAQSVSAQIVPRVYGSNLNATVYYTTNSGSSFSGVTMVETGNDYWVTSPKIPAMDKPGVIVEYYIDVQLDGPTTNSTHSYWPTGAPGVRDSYMLHARELLTSYSDMSVIGPPSTGMVLQTDYVWRGVTPKGSFPDPTFYFTNSAGSSWGDTDQPSTTLPLTGDAESDGTIDITGTVTSHLEFTFNETATNSSYSVQPCEYVYFDDWSGATAFSTYVNGEGWQMVNARTTTAGETNKAFRNAGLSCVLMGASNGYLRTPLLPQGLGTINFRYRNWADDGSVAGKLAIEKSLTGASWISVSDIETILTPDYVYVSIGVADDVNRYLRIVNGSTNAADYMCIDDVSATPPGALVVLSNPGRDPVAPTYGGQTVDVTIDYVTSGGASNLVGKVYWKSVDATDYSWAYMSDLGGSFAGIVPPTVPGLVEYYFECEYEGFNAAPVQYPDGGPASPLSFTAVGTAPSYRFQDFDTWTPLQSVFGTYTFENWQVSNGVIQAYNGFTWPYSPNSSPNMAGLNAPLADGAYPRPSVLSPLFTNGVSLVSVAFRSRFATPQTFEIQSSSDSGATWTTNAQMASSNTAFVVTNVAVHSYGETMVRVEKTGDGSTAGQYLLLDDIACYPSSADAVIQNVFLSPGYPGTADTVVVSCEINSRDAKFLAFNYRPKVVYKPKYGVWTTNAMSRTGTNTWAGTIPPQEPDTVEYFIRCDFAGFHYTNGAVTANLSPAYLPDGHHSQTLPDSFFEYVPRRYISEYSDVSVTSTIGNAEMSLVDDYTWQGIFDNVTSTQVLAQFAGLLYFTGSGYDNSTNFWGDNEQFLFDTPMSGMSTQGGADIVININTQSRSQVMFRFNTKTGIYEVRRCAYQDFNEWKANETYFNSSLNLADQAVFTNDFNSWATNQTYVTTVNRDFEDYQSWPATNSAYAFRPVSSLEVGSSNGYWIEDFVIAREAGVNVPNRAARFFGPNSGATWPHAATLTEGLETVRWRARCRYHDDYLTWYTNGLNLTNYSVSARLRGLDGGGWPTLSLLAYYQNPSNYYECQIRMTNWNGTTARHDLGIYKVVNGAKTRLNSTTRNGTISNEFTATIWVSTGEKRIRIQARTSYGANTSTTSSDTNLNAGGSIGLLTDDMSMIADDIAVSNWYYRSFDGWNTGSAWMDALTNKHWSFHYFKSNNQLWLSNNVNASIVSPYLPSPATRVNLRLDWETISVTNCILQGGYSPTGPWTKIKDISVPSGMQNRSVYSGFSDYNYLRLVNNTPTGLIRVDWMEIQTTAPVFTEDFSDGVANDWSDDSGYWYVNGTDDYRRQAYCGPAIDFKIETQYDTNTTTYPQWTNIMETHSFTISNNVYESFSQDFKFWDRLFHKISQTSGNGASLIVDDIGMSSWRATNFMSTNGLPPEVTEGWKVTEGWTAFKGAGDNCYQMWVSRADPSADQSLRSPIMTNGVGSIRFDCQFQNTTNGTYLIQFAYTSAPNSFITSHTPTPITDSTWRYNQEFEFNLATGIYVRVLHTSTDPDAIMTLDNVRISDYTARDEVTWEAYNALITPNQDLREFEPFYTPPEDVRTAYLNNDSSSNTLGGKIFTNSVPFIQSGKLAEGIGLVSFWYRNWDTNGSTPGQIKIYAAPIETTPMTNWVLLDTIANVDNKAYRLYQNDYYIRTNFFVRITSSTNTPYTRICVDNITVAEPLAADIQIQTIELTPSVPLYTTSVAVATQLGRFVMNPTNIHAKLYYHAGTDDWANIYGTWNPSHCIDLDQVVWSNSSGIKLASSSSIPAYNIDTVVQYYVECTFGGTFSEYSSPKKGRTFTNPSWYSNVNVNADKPVTNPYYIVYSCPPGTVWINEFNYKNQFTPSTNEFVELAGYAGNIVSNWHIQVMKTDQVPYGDYQLNAQQIPDDDNGFGFWILGDAEVDGVDQVYTNLAGSDNMANAGGIRLIRSCGVWEHSVSYGSGGASMTGFVYSTMKTDLFNDGTIRLTGTGDVASAFTWEYAPTVYATPGATNHGQIFEWTVPPPPSYSITIDNFWTTSSNTWLVFVSTHDQQIDARSFYTTNMVNTNWLPVQNPGFDYSPLSGTYTQWFDTPAVQAPVYFKVTSTNEP